MCLCHLHGEHSCNLATNLLRSCIRSAQDIESTRSMFEGSSKRLMFRQFTLSLQGRKLGVCFKQWERSETQASGRRLGVAVRNTEGAMMTTSTVFRSCGSSRASSREPQPTWSYVRLFADQQRVDTAQSHSEPAREV